MEEELIEQNNQSDEELQTNNDEILRIIYTDHDEAN